MNSQNITIVTAADDRSENGAFRYIDELNARAWAERNGKVDLIFSLSTRAHTLALALDYKLGIAESQRNLAVCEIFRPNPMLSVQYLLSSIDLSKELGNDLLEAQCLQIISIAYRELLDYTKAIDCLTRAMPVLDRYDDHFNYLAAISTIGTVYVSLADYDSAFSAFTYALHEAERREVADVRPIFLANIGDIYKCLGDNELALQHYRESDELKRSCTIGFENVEVNGLNNITTVLMDLSLLDEASAKNTTSLILCRERGYRDFECTALLLRAEIESRHGDLDAAEQSLIEADSIAEEIANPVLKYDVHMARSRKDLKSGDLQSALLSLTKALMIAETFGNRQQRTETLKELAAVYEKVDDAAKALEYHKLFYEAEKDLFQETARKRSIALSIAHQTKKALQEAVEQKRCADELAQINAQLVVQATQDALTELRNRRSMEDWLSAHFDRARSEGSPLAVALSDIDHFKSINDRFSHQTGDEVLQQVAKILKEACGVNDLVARYGGEEFVMGFPDTDIITARTICEGVRTKIESYDWTTIHPELRVTISIGLAQNTSYSEYGTMLTSADNQLYQAKRGGRNKVCLEGSAIPTQTD